MMKLLPWQHSLSIIKRTTPALRFDGSCELSAWQNEARKKLRELLGLSEMRTPETDGFVLEWARASDGYTDYRFTVTTEVGYVTPCRLRIPKGATKPVPLLIAMHGHSSGMHNSFREVEYERDEVANGANPDRNYAIRALEEGYATLSPEMRCMGECGAKENGQPDCYVSSMNNILCGRTTIGERVHDLSVALTAALREFGNEISSEGIICLGNSGGGTATFYAACLDERISLAASACSFCSFDDSISAMPHCLCNYIPGIRTYFDMGDLAGLIAPRKFITFNGRADDTFPHRGVESAYALAREYFSAAGVPDRIAMLTEDVGHKFVAAPIWKKIREMTE